MQVNLIPGYPDRIGKRFAWAGFVTGPTSYNPVTGDLLTLPGFQNYIDSCSFGFDSNRLFMVIAIPNAAGKRPTWVLHWYNIFGVEVLAGVNLSAVQVQLFGFGGTY